MQDVTDHPFWELMRRYGGADVYYTEYFRVHATSHLERQILRSIEENPTGRPVVAQMIGNEVAALVRSARQLQKLPVVAVDLNLGCPAPVVYRKCAGGGLLREPRRIDSILGALREAVQPPCRFTVKTRIGFESPDVFEELLSIFARHSLDLLTVHGRTVTEMYRGEIHYDCIARAVQTLSCPVLANGNVSSPAKARETLALTGAAGLMIGRGAIRNPWLFRQIRQSWRGEAVTRPLGHEVLGYVQSLYEAVCSPDVSESAQVQKMKKYLNYIAVGAEPTGLFLHEIRRVANRSEFFRVCESHLNHSEPLALEPFQFPATKSEMEPG